MIRLRSYRAQKKGVWKDAKEQSLLQDWPSSSTAAWRDYLRFKGDQPQMHMFDHLFAEIQSNLVEQRATARYY